MRHKDKYSNIEDIDEMPKNTLTTVKEESIIVKEKDIIISLNQYLSSFNRKRVLDNVIRKWFTAQDKTNPKKTKQEWDEIINKFHNETEK